MGSSGGGLEPGGGPLFRERLRRLLHGTCPPSEPTASPAGRGVPAAVLIGVLGHKDEPSLILTQRTAHLLNHPAEISLPGGRIEACDDGPEAAALRETFEEIGLTPGKVEVLGCLASSETVSGFLVYPVVGWIEPPVDFRPDGREVEEVFELPISFVLDSQNHQRGSLFYHGERHHFYVLSYPGRRIWGATAGILVDFARTLAV
jgi:8-oxo-dGTP pyrophosphatase MutT (NUDIX family)